MKHHRQVVREKAVEILRAASIPGFTEIHGSIFFPVKTLPAIFVYVESETLEAVSGAYHRTATLVVQIAMAAIANVEDQLDDAATIVETVIDPRLGGTTKNGVLTEVRFARSGDGDREIATLDLVYQFAYATTYQNPSEQR